MAGVEPGQLKEMEQGMVHDPTMSQTSSVASTASPYPETAIRSRPTSEQPLQSPTESESGSDYSQAQSQPRSRPVSTASQPGSPSFEDVSLEDAPAASGIAPTADSLSETGNGSRPISLLLQDIVSPPEEVEDSPASPTYSGSDYSEPTTPQTSRPNSTQPIANLESVPLEDNAPDSSASRDSQPHFSESSQDLPEEEQTTPKKTPSEQWSSLGHPTQDFEDVDLEVDTSSSEVLASSDLVESSSEPQTPRITVSPLSQSPAVSDYSESPPQSPNAASTPTVPLSPMTPEEARMSIDSLQSIALSESSLDYDHLSADQVDDVLSTPRVSGVRHMRKPSSLEILQNTWNPPTRQSTLFDMTKDEQLASPEGEQGEGFDVDTAPVWLAESYDSNTTSKRSSGSSERDVALDWSALDKNEEQEKEDNKGFEDESTAFLLARLEQENAKFTADPKSAVSNAMDKQVSRVRSRSRPPSMAQLKRLVTQQDTPRIRYSLAPDATEDLPIDDPPPLTELEFWAALVQDYTSTASRLPTLSTTKIRAGIPPPLRGVVWTSMSGARDKSLEEAFETLKDESSPYEGIINKDVGRSFPGVELFRDAEGEGQRMLGRVLKCYSLHDKDIGYCQGLGFLVGPLLMNMGEKEAFCVLVRLMEHYALRPSFLPSLSGLHMRIFQFSTLLAQHHPRLSEHLAALGVEPAYLSQWFLSCFAVTCPLPMLFRIYDVIFAEGANETVMRVALALFRRNEQQMMESYEFEEVMQLLLGRAIWDVYGCNADELVDDFTSLGNIITHQRLAELEKEFETKGGDAVGQSAGFLPDVQAAASRFLGRLWAPNHAHTPIKGASTTLSPQSAEKDAPGFLSRPSSFLRRTPSKTSIGTINEGSGSESSTSSAPASLASTAPTESEVHDYAATESQADSMSMKSKPESLRTASMGAGQALLPMTPGIKEQQELHTQIEDLLMALSEMQREHAQLAAMLQKEREERNDDHRVVRQLVFKLKKGGEEKSLRRSMPPPPRPRAEETDQTNVADKRRTLPPRPRPQVKEMPEQLQQAGNDKDSREGVEDLVLEVQSRLDSNARFSASFETKAQLRSNLARTREQLVVAQVQVKDLSERAESSETSLATFQGEGESLRSEVEELRERVNEDFKEKQKLDLRIQNLEIQMRMEAKAVEKKQRTGLMARAESSGEVPTLNKLNDQSRSRNGSISSAPGSSGGLRELKLGRRDSVGSVQSIRSMRGQRQSSEQLPASPVAVHVSSSPPDGEYEEVVVASAPAPTVVPPFTTPRIAPSTAPAPSAHTPSASLSTTATHTPSESLSYKPTHTPSASLSIPHAGGFAPRGSSLVAKEVFATAQHEPVPEEALLLELVNAKTAEAQARQEVDELKKSLQMQKRRAEESLLEMQAEAASSKLEAEAAKAEAEQAREDARAARDEVFDASPLATPFTPGAGFPGIQVLEEDVSSGDSTPVKKPGPKKADTAPAGSVGGWFWGRRTASTTKAVID